MIMDWNEFFDNAPDELMKSFPAVKAVILSTPNQDRPTKHTIYIDVYHEGSVSKKNINRFFSNLAEKLHGSVYRGKVFDRTAGEVVEFEGRFEPRLSIRILHYEQFLETEEAQEPNKEDTEEATS